MTRIAGPDFLALQVRAPARAAAFDEHQIGRHRAPGSPLGVVAFLTATIPFAVREPLPGTDPGSGPAGPGVPVSLGVDDAQARHGALKTHGTRILTEPFDTPFGRTFIFQDPDGYAIAIHGSPDR